MSDKFILTILIALACPALPPVVIEVSEILTMSDYISRQAAIDAVIKLTYNSTLRIHGESGSKG